MQTLAQTMFLMALSLCDTVAHLFQCLSYATFIGTSLVGHQDPHSRLPNQGRLLSSLLCPQVGFKIARRNINNLRYTDDTTLMAKSEELKSLLMKVKEEE